MFQIHRVGSLRVGRAAFVAAGAVNTVRFAVTTPPPPPPPNDDVSGATLAFIGKLVAKSGRVEVGSATRLLPSRMSKSLTERFGGKLTALVQEMGDAYGLAVGGEGTLIVPAAAARPAPVVDAAHATNANVAPPASQGGNLATLTQRPAAAPAATPPSPHQATETASARATTQLGSAAISPLAQPSPPKAAQPLAHSTKPTGKSSAAPPPPPPPPPPKLPSIGRSTPAGTAQPMATDVFNMQLRTWKSPAEVVDSLMEYVPTFWIRARHVHNALPHEMREMYQERMRVQQFLRKFQFYFDSKVTPEGPFVKVRESCTHPKKGFADDRYASSLLQDAAVATSNGGLGYANEGIDSTTLEGRLRSLVGPNFVSIKTFEAGLPPDVLQHKDYDKITGAGGVFDRFPLYFQVVDGNVRLRPTGVAPNALDERTVATSPDPELFRRIYDVIPENCDDSIDTAVLFAGLTADEKAYIKKTFRSFPRFLRQHGRVISVTQDNLTVRRYLEELPDDVDAHAKTGPGGSDEIIGKRLPSETSFDASGVEIAIKELFDVLPLAQACPLDDAVFMMPAACKEALATVDLVSELREYPSYFSVWQYPDDPSVIVVQRATLDTPEISPDEIVSTVQAMVPQGGIASEKLLRRVPLPLQRLFYRNGLKKTLSGLGGHFMVVGDRVLSLGV